MMVSDELVNKKRVLDYYREGYTIENIKMKENISEKEVLNILREYKEEQMIKGRYTDELMKFIVERDFHNFKRKEIMKELGISRNFITKSIKKYGVLSKASKEPSEELFMKVEKELDMSHCPKCESGKINEVETMYEDNPTDGYYCLNCGSEFSIQGNEVYIVKWENID